jgi:hypothetical protein
VWVCQRWYSSATYGRRAELTYKIQKDHMYHRMLVSVQRESGALKPENRVSFNSVIVISV